MAKKISKEEYLQKIEYRESDKFGKVFMPNNVFELLAKDEELQAKKSPDEAVAYCYLYLTAFLYRNAKYGYLEDEKTDVGALKELVGLSANNKDFNYVIKKGGVLDKLGLTRTLKYSEAPMEFDVREGFLLFYTQADLDSLREPRELEDRKQFRTNKKNKTFKYPVFGLEDAEEGEYGLGTFFGYVNNTHQVDFEIFLECMTNEKLGCTAFYIYSLLKHKSDVAGGSIEIGGSTISSQTGIKHTTREKALDALKKYNLITCFPAPYVVGAGKGEGANVYVVNGAERYTSTPKPYAKRELMSKQQAEEKEKFLNEINAS